MNATGVCLDTTEPRVPAVLKQLVPQAPDCLFTLGNLDLLDRKPLALFCSRRCPGNLILRTYDLAQQWREAGETVISGFHSPMEQECLRILLRPGLSDSPPAGIIVCLARAPYRRVPAGWKTPVEEGRMLIVSPFEERERRITSELSEVRNRLVAALADRVFIAYAAPGSQTEAFAQEVRSWGKPILTLVDEN